MSKIKQATKKVVRHGSRARRASHPPLSTFSGTFIPSNAWHVKLGIDDGRSAIAFVVVVGVLVLGLAGTLLGWAKTVSDLRSEVTGLRSEVARLSKQSLDAQRLVASAASAKPDFSKLQLSPISHATRTGNWYYVWQIPGDDQSSNFSPIVRFSPNNGSVVQLASKNGKGYEFVHAASPTGRYWVTFLPEDSKESVVHLTVIDLEKDAIVATYTPPADKLFCSKDELGKINWRSASSFTIDVCSTQSPLEPTAVTVSIP